jgi:mono/diheme cytochrome c family protein
VVSFQEHVLPIFERSCVQCHGGERPEGGLRTEEGLSLKTHEDIMAGSWNGSVIEPGDVENSYLIEQIITGRMPKEGPDLSPAEIEIITAWVEAGAPDN